MNRKTVEEVRSIRDALIPEIEVWIKQMEPLNIFKEGRATIEAIQRMNSLANMLSELIEGETKISGGIISKQEALRRAKGLFFFCVFFIISQCKEDGIKLSVKDVVSDICIYNIIDVESLLNLLNEFNSLSGYACESGALWMCVKTIAGDALSIINLLK